MAQSTMSPPAISQEELWARAAEELANAGVIGVTIVWADNNGIPRSQTVPIDLLPAAAEDGVGVTALFSVIDSHDRMTFTHDDLSTPSGEIRLVPEIDRLVRLKGQPAFAWAPGRQLLANGEPSPYDQRSVLERQVERAQELNLTIRAGYEIEFYLSQGTDDLQPAHHGPAYSPHALLWVDEFAAQLLRDLVADGVPVSQLHAEHGAARLKICITAADPVSAADRQLLARQTIHAAARAHGLRACFAPLVDVAGVGNVWRLHTSVWQRGKNVMEGDGPHNLSTEGAGYIAGIMRDLSALVAVTAPSVPSLSRLRPSHFGGAYRFWGIGNRAAPLRFLPAATQMGMGQANVELKSSDASGNPYLALAVVIASGLSGIEEGLIPPNPIQEDVGAWTQQRRGDMDIRRLPIGTEEQMAELEANERVVATLGADLVGAFRAVRHSDAAWALDRSIDEVVAGHRWLY
jgi:glutamine synthetase